MNDNYDDNNYSRLNNKKREIPLTPYRTSSDFDEFLKALVNHKFILVMENCTNSSINILFNRMMDKYEVRDSTGTAFLFDLDNVSDMREYWEDGDCYYIVPDGWYCTDSQKKYTDTNDIMEKNSIDIYKTKVDNSSKSEIFNFTVASINTTDPCLYTFLIKGRVGENDKLYAQIVSHDFDYCTVDLRHESYSDKFGYRVQVRSKCIINDAKFTDLTCCIVSTIYNKPTNSTKVTVRLDLIDE